MLKRPWLAAKLLTILPRRWWSLSLRARRESAVDAVVVGYMGHFDVLLARWLFRGQPIVLDHLVSASDTAEDRGQTSRWKQRILSMLDRWATNAADVIAVDTPQHRELLDRDVRANAVVVPVGAPQAWFDAAREPHANGGPVRVIFFGLYTPLQGAPTIGRAVRMALEDGLELEVTMVGTGQDLAETRNAIGEHDAVRWIDWVPADELPSLVAAHHVCLGIFGEGPKALRVVPNKVYQGAAAGCAIITSDTLPQRATLGDAGIYVPPRQPSGLADALARLAADRTYLAQHRRAAREVATRYRPHTVVTDLRDRIGKETSDPR